MSSEEIPLTKGFIAIVDGEDFETLNIHKWYAHMSRDNAYARRDTYINGKRGSIFMHRFLLGISDPKMQVDHINGNTLDNRRENLRAATNQQNNRNQLGIKSNNTSGYRGVHFYKRTKQFIAYIRKENKKKKHLGYFSTAEEAAKAFDKAAKEMYGEFCGKLNFD